MSATSNPLASRPHKSWTDSAPKESIHSKRFFLGLALIAFISLFAYLVIVFLQQGARVHFASFRILDYGDRYPKAEFGTTNQTKLAELLDTGGYKPWNYVHELGDIKNNSDLVGALGALKTIDTNPKEDTWIVQFRAHAKTRKDREGNSILETLVGETTESNNVSFREIVESLQVLPAKNVILLADICDLASSIDEAQTPIHDEVERVCKNAMIAQDAPSVWIILSAASHQPSIRSSLVGQTLFQAACEEAIAQPVESEYLSLADFYLHVSNYCDAASEHLQCPLLWKLGTEKPIPQIQNSPCELVPVAWKTRKRTLSKIQEDSKAGSSANEDKTKATNAAPNNAPAPVNLASDSTTVSGGETKRPTPRNGWEARDLIVADAYSKSPLLPPTAFSPKRWRQTQLELLQNPPTSQTASDSILEFYERWAGTSATRPVERSPLWLLYKAIDRDEFREWKNTRQDSAFSNLSPDEANDWYGDKEIRSNYIRYMNLCSEARFWQEWVWLNCDLEATEENRHPHDDFVRMMENVLTIRTELLSSQKNLLQTGRSRIREFQSAFKHHASLQAAFDTSVQRLMNKKSLNWKSVYELDLLLSSPLLKAKDRQNLESLKREITSISKPSRFESPSHFSTDMSWSKLKSKKSRIQDAIDQVDPDSSMLANWFKECFEEISYNSKATDDSQLLLSNSKGRFLKYPGNPNRLILDVSKSDQEPKWLDFPIGKGNEQPTATLRLNAFKANRVPLDKILVPMDLGSKVVRLEPPPKAERMTIRGKEHYVLPVQDQRVQLKFVLKQSPLLESSRLAIETLTLEGESATLNVLVTQNAAQVRLKVKRNYVDGSSQWIQPRQLSTFELESAAALDTYSSLEFFLNNELDKTRYFETRLLSQSLSTKKPIELAKSERIALSPHNSDQHLQALKFRGKDEKTKALKLGKIDDLELVLEVTEWTSLEANAQKISSPNNIDRFQIRIAGENPATPEFLTVESNMSLEATASFWNKYRAEKLKIVFEARDFRDPSRQLPTPQPIELTLEKPSGTPNLLDSGDAVDLYLHVGGYPRAAMFRRNSADYKFEPIYRYENTKLLDAYSVTIDPTNNESKSNLSTDGKWIVPNRKGESLREVFLQYALDFPAKRGTLVMLDSKKNVSPLQQNVNDREIDGTLQWNPESSALELQLTPSDRTVRIEKETILSRADGEYVIGWIASPDVLPSNLADNNLSIGAPFTFVVDRTAPTIQRVEANVGKPDGAIEQITVQFKAIGSNEKIDRVSILFPNDRNAKGLDLIPIPIPSKKEEFKAIGEITPEYALLIKQLVDGKQEAEFRFIDHAGNSTSVRTPISRSSATIPPKTSK